MDNKYLAGRLQRLSLFLAMGMLPAMPALAAVTYEGTNGVAATVYNSASYSTLACADCHSNAGGTLPHLENWTDVNTYGSSTDQDYACGTGSGGNISGFNYMAKRVSCGEMPSGDDLNATGKSLFASWQSGGFPRWAAPDVTTGTASSVNKYNVYLNGTINENGSNASTASGYGAYFKYSTSSLSVSSGFGTTSSKTNPAGTGGGTSSTAYSIYVSGLNCGTTYYFRAYGDNAQGQGTGGTQNFTTDACPTITQGASISPSTNEETTLNQFLSANQSVTWSISSQASNGTASVSAGASSSKTVSYTPDGNYFGSDSFVVQITDGTTTDSITVNVTVNNTEDPPSVNGGTVPASGSIAEDVARSFNVDASDPDGQTLTYTLVTTPDISAELLSSNCSTGSYSTTTGAGCWVPDGTITSVDFDMTVSDTTAGDEQLVSWTWNVTASNDPPVFDEDPSTSAAAGVLEDATYSYDVQASDIDGDTLVYSLLTTPDISGDASYSFNTATGLFSWTPDQARAGASISVTAEVTDSTVTISDSWTIDVTPVNGAPVLSAVADQNVTELSTLTLEMGSYVTDEDDDNASGELSWSFVEPPAVPAGMAISNSASTYGQLTWTPGENTEGTYNIVVQVEDGGEDSALPDTVSFDVIVAKLDTDNDTVADYDDNCPAVANTDQANNDGDAFGDLCDSDDDNDGISDAVELNNGLDPFNAADAALDLDGDGLTNLEEAQACETGGDTTTCEAISVDSVPPAITVVDVTVDATGFYTEVQLEASAEDGNDGTVAAYITAIDGEVVSLASGTLRNFRPGHHEVTWESQDSVGNTSSVVQNVDIRPLVTLGGSKVSAEGQNVSLTVTLNGASPAYPVTVNYLVGGDVDGGDYTDANAGSITIADPDTGGLIELAITADGVAEADETLSVTLDSVSAGAALSSPDNATVLITEAPLPPEVTLSLDQNGRQALQVYQGDGNVAVTATPVYGNNGLTFDWSGSSVAIIGSGASVAFDPDALAPGSYTLAVQAFDGVESASQQLTVLVVATMPTLGADDSDGDGIDDLTEGLDDTDLDGIPDYLDAVADTALQQPGADSNGVAAEQLMRVTPGLSLRLGGYAVAAGRSGAVVTGADVTDALGQMLKDPAYTIVGRVFDFDIVGLNPASRTAQVVLPLPVTIPAGAVFRKADSTGWYTFSGAGADAVHSAHSVNGLCPDLGSADWQAGLVQSTDCVRLTLTDGGANDADGEVNGVIRDPGGTAVANDGPADPPPPTDVANESGGAALWWLLVMILGGAGRAVLRKQ